LGEVSEQPSSGRKFKFQYGIKTDVGRKREENQDSHGHAHTSEASVFIVADGMGGAKGGASASALAVDAILKSVFTQDAIVTEGSLRSALVATNDLIHNESKASDELTGMGTTAVVVAFVMDQLLVGHVGDSRGYMLRSGTLTRLTRDHTLVQELVDSGAIDQEDAKNHPIAHMLTRSLGPTAQVEAEVMTFYDSVQENDVFLLCCDGLYNLVKDSEIEEILRDNSPEVAADLLVEMALARGGTDNITVEIIKARGLASEDIDFVIPEPGKLRLVLSREAPPLRSPEIPPVDQSPAAEPEKKESAPESSSEKRKSKRKRAIDEVLFTQSGEKKEDPEESEDAVDAEVNEPKEAEPNPEELKEFEELRKLRFVGYATVLLAIGAVSYLLLVRGTSPAAKVPAATTSTTSTTVLKAIPTEEAVAPSTASQHLGSDAINAILGEATSAPEVVFEQSPKPTERFSEEERVLLGQVLSTSAPERPRLRQTFPVTESSDSNTLVTELFEPAPERLLSEGEKRELLLRKSELRDSLQQIDLKLSVLDALSTAEINKQRIALENVIQKLELLQGRLEDELQINKTESELWSSRERMAGSVDSVRIAGEISPSDPQVAQSHKLLRDLQEKYQAVLDAWNSDKTNQDLIAQTAALSREIKSQKAQLDELVKNSLSSGKERSASEKARLEYALDRAAKLLTIKREQLGFIRAAEPNVSGRNASRLKSLLRDREEVTKRLSDYEKNLSDAAEREILKDYLSF